MQYSPYMEYWCHKGCFHDLIQTTIHLTTADINAFNNKKSEDLIQIWPDLSKALDITPCLVISNSEIGV